MTSIDGPHFLTERLILRPWKKEDIEPFARFNRDPNVVEHLAGPLEPEQSWDLVNLIVDHFAQQGFGLWAIELRSTGNFIGFAGLNIPLWKAHFTPCVEVGWRLGFEFWGNGYATEAAREALRIGFQIHRLPEIVSFTIPRNARSIRIMEKLGMKRDPKDDFDHPRYPTEHPIARHILYRHRNPLQI